MGQPVWSGDIPPDNQSSDFMSHPAHEIRLGKVKATLWANETENGSIRYNVVFSRLYKSEDQWKTADSFYRDDLPLLSKVADLAHTWLFEQTEKA